MTIYGESTTGEQVEQSVVDLLKLWLPSYLANLERLTSRAPGAVSVPRSYLITNRFERRPEDQIPACIVISPGLSAAPVQHGDGTLSGWFRIEAGIMAAARTREESNSLAKLYGAALLMLLVQKRAAVASGRATIAGMTNDAVPTSLLDVGSAVVVLADVPVAVIADANGGPPAPEDLDPGDWLDVDTVHIDIERRSLV